MSTATKDAGAKTRPVLEDREGRPPAPEHAPAAEPAAARSPAGPRAAAFMLTALTLGGLQGAIDRPLLLAERFVPGLGWLQVGVMATYAAWVVGKLLDPALAARWRLRIWGLFSAVFFGQLLLGLAGAEQFLMTGKLHLPVPAMIVAGPIFRGAGFFMPVLFTATVLLVGPAWCSYLCYIGAWEGIACSGVKKPSPLPRWRSLVRLALLLLVVVSAAALRLAGVGWLPALLSGAAFGLVGVGIMLLVSRKTGMMTHCVSYCPIGLLANVLGKVSPFRIKIREGCNSCMLCTRSCRYDALTPRDLDRGRPGLSCTLCGDCVAPCPKGLIRYALPWVGPAAARVTFLVLAVSLHAVFLAVARI